MFLHFCFQKLVITSLIIIHVAMSLSFMDNKKKSILE